MKKISKVLLTLVMILLMTLSLCSCKSESKKYVGEYTGTSGSYLNLHEDGTCIYAEPDKTGTGSGTWTIEDDTITVNVSNLDYPIYAKTEFDDKGLLFQSNNGSWDDEYFVFAD